MSKVSRSSAAVLEAPPPSAAAEPTARVTVVAPGGLCYNELNYRMGDTLEVPGGVASRWIAEGKARREAVTRVLALKTQFIGNRTVGRGETVETSAVHEEAVRLGLVVPLQDGQSIPDPLPPEPLVARDLIRGPKVRVEVLKRGRYARGLPKSSPGDVIELHEEDAVHRAHYKLVTILDELSAVGRECAESYRRSIIPASYESIARRHQKALEAPGNKAVPTVAVKALKDGDYGSGFKMKGTTFRIGEGLAVAPIMLGRIELAEEASPELARRLKAARAVAV